MDFKTMINNFNTEKRILISGCGCGKSAIELAKTVDKDAYILAIDPSSELIEMANHRKALSKVSNIDFKTGKTDSLGQHSGSFDVVFVGRGESLKMNRNSALDSIAKVLKVGGKVIFFDSIVNTDVTTVKKLGSYAVLLGVDEALDKGMLQKRLHSAGFSEVDIKPVCEDSCNASDVLIDVKVVGVR